MITGESIPVTKEIGGLVFGSTVAIAIVVVVVMFY